MEQYDWDFSFSNIGQFYECFVRHESQNAAEECLDYLDSNANKLLADQKSFDELPYSLMLAMISRDTFCAKEVDILQAVIRWHRKHMDCDLNELFKRIRWNFISGEQYFLHIRPFDVITDDQYFNFALKKNAPRVSRDTCLVDNCDTNTTHISKDTPAPVAGKTEDLVVSCTADSKSNTARMALEEYEDKWSFYSAINAYICEICKVSFARLEQVKKHLVRHYELETKNTPVP